MAVLGLRTNEASMAESLGIRDRTEEFHSIVLKRRAEVTTPRAAPPPASNSDNSEARRVFTQKAQSVGESIALVNNKLAKLNKRALPTRARPRPLCRVPVLVRSAPGSCAEQITLRRPRSGDPGAHVLRKARYHAAECRY